MLLLEESNPDHWHTMKNGLIIRLPLQVQKFKLISAFLQRILLWSFLDNYIQIYEKFTSSSSC